MCAQLYVSDIRSAVKADNPKAGVTDMMKLLAAKWKELSESDRKVSVLGLTICLICFAYTIWTAVCEEGGRAE